MTTVSSAPSRASAPGPVGKLGYIAGLDGLRALAVGLVFLYHGNWFAVKAGFVGVDLFFVLSGFLITRLLLEEFEHTGGVALRAFFIRRALRLFPALFVFLGSIAVIAAITDIAELERNLTSDIWSSVFYVRNYYDLVEDTGYGPLGHLWTLSVEEQFYLIWPFLGALAMKRGGGEALAKMAAIGLGIAAASSILRAAAGGDILVLYRGTISHGAVGLLAGAFLGARPDLLRRVTPGDAQKLAVAGVAGLIGLSFVDGLDTTHAVTGFVPVTLLCLAAVVGVAALPHIKPPGPVVFFGKVSYGFYLWHLPLITIIATLAPGGGRWGLLAKILAASLAATLISYFVVERPAMRLKSKLSN